MENSINLNELAPLYDEFYIIGEAEKSPPKETEKINKTAIFLGGNKSRILMIYQAQPAISEPDREMVHNLIVNAIKISWDDVAFLNLHENPDMDFEEMVSFFGPEKILSWGCEHFVKTADGAKYNMSLIGNTRIMLADAISQYHDNRDLKVKLWTSVQQLLGLV